MIPAFLVARFGQAGAKVAFFAAIAAVIALALLLTYCAGRTDGKSHEVVGELQRENKVQQDVGRANENASDTRLSDEQKLQSQVKELNDAALAAKSPDNARALRGCVVLRQQGRDTSRIPACR